MGGRVLVTSPPSSGRVRGRRGGGGGEQASGERRGAGRGGTEAEAGGVDGPADEGGAVEGQGRLVHHAAAPGTVTSRRADSDRAGGRIGPKTTRIGPEAVQPLLPPLYVTLHHPWPGGPVSVAKPSSSQPRPAPTFPRTVPTPEPSPPHPPLLLLPTHPPPLVARRLLRRPHHAQPAPPPHGALGRGPGRPLT
jgi:hypothetical protein